MEKPIVIGAVLFEGFELLDVFGPLEMFGLLEDKARILMLAEQPGTLRSHAGPSARADLALASAPPLDVLLVPGGLGTRTLVANSAFLATLAQAASQSRWITSVCTGSILLAQAGLLEGQRATSNKRVFRWVQGRWPNIQWLPEARWVESGNVWTASGISAGMDMALALIERIFDRPTAQETANRAEYEWHADSRRDPFAKANGLA